jgi:type II secretory pathway component PulJ
MDLNLTGTEVHALREALETVIFEMERKIAGLADPETRKELGRSRDALRSIKDKLPAGLIEVA